jgi:hypothetical protein
MHQLEGTFAKAFLNNKNLKHKKCHKTFLVLLWYLFGGCGHEIFYVQSGKIVENVWIVHQHQFIETCF